ncbi:MAG: hypothetical protein QF464_24220, partial [Myxococcota bacterium]|nr:hypothetical protein [Myxococcota bacterium]
VCAVLEHATGEAQATPLAASQDDWVAQDVAWRLLTIRAETDGEPQRALDGMAEQLAAKPGDETLRAVIADYTALAEDWVVPPPEDVFAVGYDLPSGHGRSLRQCADGLQSALPATWAALGAEAVTSTAHWLATDRAERLPIGRRFARWVSTESTALGDQATFEAAVTHAPRAHEADVTLQAEAAQGAPWRLAEGVELLRLQHAVDLDPTVVARAGIQPTETAQCLAVLRAVDGEVEIVRLDDAVFDRLTAGDLDGLSPHYRAELAQIGLLRPQRWAETLASPTED